jgi:hypothetical protein
MDKLYKTDETNNETEITPELVRELISFAKLYDPARETMLVMEAPSEVHDEPDLTQPTSPAPRKFQSAFTRTKPRFVKPDAEQLSDMKRVRIARINEMTAKHAGTKTTPYSAEIKRVIAGAVLDVPIVLALAASDRPTGRGTNGRRIQRSTSRLSPPTALTLRYTGAVIRYAEKIYSSAGFLARTGELKEHLRSVYTRVDAETNEAVPPRVLLDNVALSADADLIRAANKQNESIIEGMLAEVAWDQIASPLDTAVLLSRVATALTLSLCGDQLGLDAVTNAYLALVEDAMGSGNKA